MAFEESGLIRGVAFGELPDNRGGLWREWPDKRGGLWKEWPYKKGTTVLLESYKIYRLLCFVYRLGYNGRQTWQYIH